MVTALRPLFCDGAAEGLRLHGRGRPFSRCEVVRDDGATIAREIVSLETLTGRADTAATLRCMSEPLAPFAGLDLASPRVMGVINVTPDSFSDGGDLARAEVAIEAGRTMAADGAAILDIGGESTRPGAEPIDIETELDRVLPVIRTLAAEGHLVSIDTRRAEVMDAAVAAGARIVNDVTALTGDPESLSVVVGHEVPVVLMHMQGEPRTMQKDPTYRDAPLDVYAFLAGRIAACETAGIDRSRIAVDPGIGFGKTVGHNLQLLNALGLFHGLGCPVLLGASRKSFIGKLSAGEPAKARLPGSLAAVLAGLDRGVQLYRVHDVAETRQAIAVAEAIAGR